MKRLAAIMALLALANPKAWAQTGAERQGDAKRVIITFKAGTAETQRLAALQSLNARPVDEILSNDHQKQFVAVVAELQDGRLPESIQAAGDIVKVEPDVRLKWIEVAAPALPSGGLKELGLKKFSRAPTPAALRDEITWGVWRVRAPAAWDYTEGAGVRVAVIDTGIDSSHPDLSGKVDGGYNAINDCERIECFQDDNGHGTHVAGTIGAVRNGRGVVGVAPRARLYAVKVLDGDGSGTLSDVVKGIIWAANNGMQVANMSLGSPFPSPSMERALRYAKARGVVVVAAAGNSGGSVSYPGAYTDSVIAVSASDWEDKIADFSSRGKEVTFIAPGDGIISTWPGGDYANLRGTSMAAPHVAGLAALSVAQGYRGLDGPDGVLAQLVKAAWPLDRSRSKGSRNNEEGYGMIDGGALTRTFGGGIAVMASAGR